MRTPIYWHRLIYRNTYGRSHPDFEKRFEIVAALIEPGASVLDVCCGDARLYTHYLKHRDCDYVGIDLSLSMVPHQVLPSTIKGNAGRVELPVMDYVVMMESLYHFHPDTVEMVKRMLRTARKKVIILEQVRNKIASLPKCLKCLLSDPGNGSGDFRFSRKELEEVVGRADPKAERRLIINDYDLLIIMNGTAKE